MTPVPAAQRAACLNEFHMANKMLIDAAHPEETRVVVLRGNRVEEFDFESANKKQLRGNIYLAKVTRVEPSLQAAFVDYAATAMAFSPFPRFIRIIIRSRLATARRSSKRTRAPQREEEEDEPRSRRSRRHSRDRNGQHAAKRHDGDDETLAAAAEDEQFSQKPAEVEDFGDDTGVVFEHEHEHAGEELPEEEAAEHEHRGNPDIEPVLEISVAAAAADVEELSGAVSEARCRRGRRG